MSFLAKHTVNADERLIYLARLHWIYVLIGFWWFLFFAVAGVAVNITSLLLMPAPKMIHVFQFSLGYSHQWFFLLMLFCGIAIWVSYILEALFTEIAITNQRIIIKTGFIATEVQEIDLEEIKSEKVDNGIFGGLLNYGSIHMDCRFIHDVDIASISNPYRFLRALHKLEKISHSTVAVK